MAKPVLVVMAAGMGSRFGGLKQVRPVGPYGQALMDYSLFDAKQAGFSDVIFVISPSMAENGFMETMGKRLGSSLCIRCAVQEITDMPAGLSVPEGRTKPWGTGHAVRACRREILGSFAVINADDYYGPDSFREMYGFLSGLNPDSTRRYGMVGYQLMKTLSESGSVARGICQVDGNGRLMEIHERTRIVPVGNEAEYTEDGQVFHRLPASSVASMNFWGFSLDFMEELDVRFVAFLNQAVRNNPLKGEYFLPEIVAEMLREGSAQVDVLPSHDQWYGVTYQQDLPAVQEAIGAMTARGLYPEALWA